ncbi:hypothetical protein GQ54DRAFT_336437, partial [Martensiomyces pterosporus]
MARLQSIILAILAPLALVSAFPAFNTPNSVDVHGNACPLVDRQGLVCPTLCVRDFSDCPTAIKPDACKQGEQLCDDGACHASCAAVINPCLCEADPATLTNTYRACPAYTDSIIVKNYDPSIKEAQLEYTCAMAWGLIPSNATFDQGSGISSWASNATDTRIWGACPTPQDAKLTFKENFCLAFYGILGAEVVLFALWHFYKGIRERHADELRQICSQAPTKLTIGSKANGEDIVDEKAAVRSADEKGAATDGSSSSSDLVERTKKSSAAGLEDGMMLLRGFDNNYAGALLYCLALLSTAGWIVALAIIVSDYYGVVKGGVAYGLLASSNTSMAVFIFVWHLGGIWMITMLACMHKIRNYFRIECPLHQARVVQIEERRDEVIMMEGNANRLTAIVNRVRDAIVHRFGLNIVTETCPTQHIKVGEESRMYIEYHCTRYVYDREKGKFQCNAFDLGNTHRALLSNRSGLSEAEASDRASRIGENFIRVAVPSFPIALLQEFFNYFYLYQMMCMWVWFYFNYYKMALVQFGVIIISAFIKVAIRLRSEHKVKSLAEHKSECRVKRDGQWVTLNTADLVPGDVVAVEAGMEVMCDGCVISGEVVVDESSLTGEAMPVRKLPLKNDVIPYDVLGAGKTYSVFAGTKVLQCTGSSMISPSPSQPTLLANASPASAADLKHLDGGSAQVSESPASTVQREQKEPETQVLVTHTRTGTDKGKLIQRILFPTMYSFVFDEQLRVALLILLTYGGFGFAVTIWLMGHDVTSWFYGVFVISEIMSPLLPAALVVGQSVAADRLRRQQIFCVDLPRIMMAGKVQVFCFDKTGTLTKEGLEYFAVQGVSHEKRSQGSEDAIVEATSSNSDAVFAAEESDMSLLSHTAQIGFAACHAVTVVGDKLIGNPVDVEQFRATDWELVPSEDRDSHLDTLVSPFLESHDGSEKLVRKTVHVVKRFEFVHARQSMSVAVYDPDTRHVHVFVKGSFERLKRISNPQSVPANYDSVTAKWAKEGCYVLALSHKDLGPVEDLSDVAKVTREQMEAGCDLISLLLFRNKLKEDTASAILELKGGDTRTVMITGDTALTGVYIARQCSMISPTTRVLLGDMEKRQHSEAGESPSADSNTPRLVWRDTVTDEVVDDIDRLLYEERVARDDAEHKLGDVVSKRTSMVELAVTAAAFNHLVAVNKIRQYLFDIRIFARMTPQGKVDCVNLHMERAVTAMCGDGGNDCGALRAAHVGLALSESEASIVSPFSSSNRSIHSCVTLLREGRAGLATSFAGYKFLINYATTMSM